MNEINEFILKLENLNWRGYEDDTLISEEGFELSYRTKLHGQKGSGSLFPPIQTIWYISYDKKTIFSYGCISNAETQRIVDFYLNTKYSLADKIYKDGIDVEKEGEMIWNNLI